MVGSGKDATSMKKEERYQVCHFLPMVKAPGSCVEDHTGIRYAGFLLAIQMCGVVKGCLWCLCI